MLLKDEVQHIANLARIKLTKRALERYAKDLSSILEYVDQLAEVDTTKVQPLRQVGELENVWQSDKPQKDQCLSQNRALKNAPKQEKEYFKVNSVF